MKTAEVAIEHVLTGILALCAFALPLLAGSNNLQKLFTHDSAVVGVLGAAYLIGVVFDRLADTMLSPMEQYLRLKMAMGWLAERLKNNDPLYKGVDPFPQDALEFNLRGGEGGRLEWIDSLRGRIRTCRGLAVFGAPAAMGVAIFIHFTPGLGIGQWNWRPRLVVGLNLACVLLSLAGARLLSGKKDSWRASLKPTRTNELSETSKLAGRWHTLVFSFSYLLMQVTSLAATSNLRSNSWQPGILIFVCGAVLVSLALWAWYRITATYMSFVYRQMPELMKHELPPNVGPTGIKVAKLMVE